MKKLCLKKYSILLALLILVSCSKETQTINQTIQKSESNSVKKIAADGEVNLDWASAAKAEFIYSLGAFPDKRSVDYFSISEFLDSQTNKKNILVSGKSILVEEGSPSDINLSGNLGTVTIEAEELVIKKKLLLPGAKVILNVHKLIFEENGKIVTTPHDFSTRAEVRGNGKKGARGGDIILNVSELFADAGQVRFELTGGRGQEAGLGVTGKPGKSVYPLYEGTNIIRECETRIEECNEVDKGLEHKFPVVCRGSSDNPTAGAVGEIAGHPGAGGDSGNIYLPESLLQIEKGLFLTNPGEMGKVAADTPYGSDGTPFEFQVKNITIKKTRAKCSSGYNGHATITNQESFIKGVIENSSKNKVIPSPKSPLESSSGGSLLSLGAERRIFTGRLLIHQFNYAKDLYRNNYFNEAQTELKNVLVASEAILDEVQVSLVQREAQVLLNQLLSQKDFYGMPLDAVPQISLVKLLTAYKKEINDSFETLKFTSYFANKVKTAEEKRNRFLENKEHLSLRIEKLKEENDEAYKAFPLIINEIEELKRDQNAFDVALAEVENEIEKEAQRNVDTRNRKKKLIGAIRLVATLAKVSPVGQPAAAAIGTSIDTIVSATENEDSSILDKLKTGYDIFQSVRDIDFKKSKENWNEKYSNLYYDKFKTNNPEIKDHRFEKYLKNTFETTKPLFDAASKYYKDYIATEVPRSEYEAEVQKIKSLNPRFKTLVERLSLLQAKKEQVNNFLIETLSTINQTESEINNSYVMIAAAESDYLSFSNGLNFSVNDLIEFYEKNAKNSLMKYKLILAKASAYRLLKPIDANLNIHKIEEQMVRFASSNGESIDIEMLKRLYKADLSNIADNIFTQIESGSLKEYEGEILVDLNKKEINALLSNKQVAIPLGERSPLKANEENARVISISLNDVVLNSKSKNGNVDFIVNHGGQSFITKDGREYKFTHINANDIWISRLDLSNGTATLLEESPDTENLFSALFDDNRAQEKGSLYGRVGFNSKFFIKLVGNLAELDIQYAQIKVKYSFSHKQ